jgi:RNA polymerase sigma-70 factor (ECF subfamily)
VLAVDYDNLAKQLTRKLGSSDLATEALNETFLRLENVSEAKPVGSPKGYLFRIAVNIATDRRREENRRLSSREVDTLLEIADESPDPAQIAEARSEVEAFKQAIAELPDRRQRIVLGVLVEGTSSTELAARFGVSVRTVEIEVKRALEHGALRLKRKLTQRFGPRPRKPSKA